MRAAFIALLLTLPAAAQTCSNHQSPAQIDARIDALIAQMSPAERIAQLGDRAPALPRLHLPAYNWWNEGLHGIARNGYATVFPQAIGLAATFDPALLHQVGDTVSTEARSKFNPHRTADSARYAGLTLWSPNINIFRDPRWGRGQETYGEDPYLTATLGSAFVRGVQGDDPFYLRADATPKHFVAHSGPEPGRDSFNALVSPHDLADTYLPAFHALLSTAHAAALMCSYNGINGIPSCANDLLQHTVRDAWRFPGYIVSDCDAVGNLTSYQHYTSDAAHAAAAALNAGVDLDCGSSYHALNAALAQHLVTTAIIDRALHRLLLARLHLGLLDPAACTPYNRIRPAADDTAAHRALALRAAEESIVLLHNDDDSSAWKQTSAWQGRDFRPAIQTPTMQRALAPEGAAPHTLLPLNPSRHIAVIGPNADSLAILEANYHGTASHPVTELDGLLAAFPHLTYAQGSLLAEGLPLPIPRTALRASAMPSAPSGLTADYFSNPDLAGTPAVQQIIPTLQLDLDRVAPSPRITAARYSARWTTLFTPPALGDYILHVALTRCWDCTTHDHFRLFVDGALVLDNPGHDPDPSSYTLHAADTHPHALRLELLHTGDDEGIALEWQPPAAALLAQALHAVQQADVIVAVVGLSPQLEGEALSLHLDGFDGGDRTTLQLPAPQRDLLHALQSLHKPLIIVLNSGSAVALDPADYAANALLEAWYPGEEGGHGLARILTGAASPSGRLPITFYRSVASLPPVTDYSMAHRTYRYFDGPVLYPFGFGLTYAHFAYGRPHLDASTLAPGHGLHATLPLQNTSARAATATTQLYLIPPPDAATPAPTPRLILVGTQRTMLQPHQRTTLHFTLTPQQLSLTTADGTHRQLPGTYRLFAGPTPPTPAQLADPAFTTTLHLTPNL